MGEGQKDGVGKKSADWTPLLKLLLKRPDGETHVTKNAIMTQLTDDSKKIDIFLELVIIIRRMEPPFQLQKTIFNIKI